jgi:hypothetical protein
VWGRCSRLSAVSAASSTYKRKRKQAATNCVGQFEAARKERSGWHASLADHYVQNLKLRLQIHSHFIRFL